jgi:hypothetical protein
VGFFKRLGKNWKTSLAGAATLASVGFKIANGQFDFHTDPALITAGIGLLLAKSNTVTGGISPQDGGTVPTHPENRPMNAGGTKPQ